jgi:hypothetical protein
MWNCSVPRQEYKGQKKWKKNDQIQRQNKGKSKGKAKGKNFGKKGKMKKFGYTEEIDGTSEWFERLIGLNKTRRIINRGMDLDWPRSPSRICKQ